VPGPHVGGEQARQCLAEFRETFYDCLLRRADALFELTDAVLCAPGPVTSLPELSLALVHRRGHGALYDGLACGEVDVARLRMAVAAPDLPRDGQGRLRLAVDVTPGPTGRRVLPGPVALPPAVPLRRDPADHCGLAVLDGGGAGVRALVVDRAAGRGAHRPR
jgi:hypothetical protein